MLTSPKICSVEPIFQTSHVSALESGQILYFAEGGFELGTDEQVLLSETLLQKGKKNISYDTCQKKIRGVNTELAASLLKIKAQSMLERYAQYAKNLVLSSCPEYKDALIWGRTSYRPAKIEKRTISKRKDDTKLHVDSFASMPVDGQRILRVFCNVNPNHEPRVWHVGEKFDNVLARFSPAIPGYSKVLAKVMHKLAITKSLRSEYDHIMLKLHDFMKLDGEYQAEVKKEKIEFPSNASWIVFTDQVSHAALSGQYLLEQTFYLNVEHMANPKTSPLYAIKQSEQWGDASLVNR